MNTKKNIASTVKDLITITFSAAALLLSFLSYEQSKADREFDVSIDSVFSEPNADGIDSNEKFIISRTNGKEQLSSVEGYSALTYIDIRDNKEKIIPVTYLDETKKIGGTTQKIEVSRSKNNIDKMNALDSIRKKHDKIIRDAYIANAFKVSFKDSNNNEMSRYFSYGSSYEIVEIDNSNFLKFLEKYNNSINKIAEVSPEVV